jgi:D-alanyl-lipoteichoic acid acyltransferase DltB (MBOAT superfamily)
MDFSSIEFFIFLISVLIFINSFRKSQYQQAILICASYLFYWTTSNFFILLLLFITIISYQSGEAIYQASSQGRKKSILAIALIGLLIPLGFFKYYNFGIEILKQLIMPFNFSLNIPFLDLILPIGISFFTFSAISYVIDIYNGTIQPEKKFYRYALFVSYFPHLLAGPIVRAGQFLPQLKKSVAMSPENLKNGVTLMMWGFVKKFVIADNFAVFVNAIFSHPTDFNSVYIIIGTILFGIQIYCDFSGYIDIALGTAELIGLHLPQNFFRPYLSKNPTEFWRRWNITLSSFIRDYIYIPLGGNKKGTIRTYFNLEITWFLCGLWHGAAWNFIIWGIYHGFLLSLHKIISKQGRISLKLFSRLNENFRLFSKIIITQYFIFIGWIIFRVHDLTNIIYCVNKFVIFDFNFSNPKPAIWGITGIIGIIGNLGFLISFSAVTIFLVVIVYIIHNKYCMQKIIRFLTTDWIRNFSSLELKYWSMYLTIMIFIILCFKPGASPEFIYYQF